VKAGATTPHLLFFAGAIAIASIAMAAPRTVLVVDYGARVTAPLSTRPRDSTVAPAPLHFYETEARIHPAAFAASGNALHSPL
jgi:hypothetical protein